MSFKRLTTIQAILAVIVGFGLVLLLYTPIDAYVFNWQYTGFGPKTIWDWLDLLIIPLVLAVGGYVFARADRQAELERAEQQVQTEREIAEDRLREEALQAYLDRMSELLIEKGLRNSDADAEVRSVARAQTLSVLRRLDGNRKGALLQFLHESNLISFSNMVISLKSADLSGAVLSWTSIEGANLEEVDLRGAKFRGAVLKGVSLHGAMLDEADFRLTSFEGCDLCYTFLRGANLHNAFFQETRLEGADLSNTNLEAAKLKGANLEGVSLEGANVTSKQLTQAVSLKGATMPDGSIHD